MKKTAKDPIREDRIHQEAIVDAYGSEEKAMSWYYYLESKLTFPFYAKETKIAGFGRTPSAGRFRLF